MLIARADPRREQRLAALAAGVPVASHPPTT